MNWLTDPCRTADTFYYEQALERQAQLTKPPQALGELETVAIRLASLQSRAEPQAERIHISVFAGDHGIVAEGVSAFPQAVSVQMVHNFLQGGAAISVLAQHYQAQLEVIDTGLIEALPAQTGLISCRAGAGTANSLHAEAMTSEQLAIALQAGYEAVERAHAANADIFIGGDMGIGNTTAATALYCALLNLAPASVTGAGTGLSLDGIAHKSNIINQILQRHAACADDALAWLRCVGGFEIAALTGAYLRAGQVGLVVLLDGFISTAAALVAVRLQPALKEWLFLSHNSAERGHTYAIQALGLRPLLDLDLRLGEGSGAALAIPLLRSACALHNQMATFAEAAVAGKQR